MIRATTVTITTMAITESDDKSEIGSIGTNKFVSIFLISNYRHIPICIITIIITTITIISTIITIIIIISINIYVSVYIHIFTAIRKRKKKNKR